MMGRRPSLGFTLLEVLIALVILAGALTVLLGTQANHVQMGQAANEMSVAGMLGRQKMLEVESDLAADGFNEGEQSDRGNFRKEGFDYFEWEVTIEPVNIDESSQETLLADANASLFGEGDSGGGGTFTGNAAFASYLPLVVGLIPEFINRLGERVRKVTLVLSWEGVYGKQTLTLEQYVNDLGHDKERQDKKGLSGKEDPNLLLEDLGGSGSGLPAVGGGK
jgi:prepilin-type N-terminal cleavage/methylation domain-containing protein